MNNYDVWQIIYHEKGMKINNENKARNLLNKRKSLKEIDGNIPENMVEENKDADNDDILHQAIGKKYAKVIKGINNKFKFYKCEF